MKQLIPLTFLLGLFFYGTISNMQAQDVRILPDRIGVGTNTPLIPLHVKGSDMFSFADGKEMARFESSSVGESSDWIGFYDGTARRGTVWKRGFDMALLSETGNIDLYANGFSDISDLHVSSNGNVGINTNTPLTKLHVRGDIYFANNALVSNAENGNLEGTNVDHIWHDDTPGANIWHFVSDEAYKSTGNGRLAAGGLLVNSLLNGDNKLTVKIDANGNSIFSNLDNYDNNGSTGNEEVLLFSQSGVSFSVGQGPFGPGGSLIPLRRMVIDDVGNVGIGTQSPDYRLDVSGDVGVRDENAQIEVLSDDNQKSSLKLFEINVSEEKFGFEFELDGNNDILNLWSRGYANNEAIRTRWFKSGEVEMFSDLGVAGIVFANDFMNNSDRRFKRDIKPLRNSLQKIQQLRGVSYYFKQKDFSKRNFDEKEKLGLIAQEVEKVFPQLVKTQKDGYKAVNYVALIPVLIEAMKEQNDLLEAKAQRIDELETRLAKVEALLDRLSLDNSTGNPQLPTTNIQLTDAQLFPNQPNPFGDRTLIRYFIPEKANIAEIKITNLEGQLIRSIPLETMGPGQVQIDATNLSAGMYLYSLLVDGQLIATEKMVLGKN